MVLNADDPHFVELKAIAPTRLISYAVDGDADVRPVRYDAMGSGKGTEAVFASPVGELRIQSATLLGKPNLYNIGAALGGAIGLRRPREGTQTGVGALALG